MNLAFMKITRQVRIWNKRPLNTQDFYRICRRERVRVHELPLRVAGFYMVIKGKPHIYLNNRLRGLAWLQAAFHELGHHLLHAPVPGSSTAAYFYQLTPNTKEEKQAEAFAAVALIPELLLRKNSTWELQEEYGYPSELLWLRREIYERYKV